MSSLNTDTDNDTKVVDLLKKSSETEKSSKITGKKSEEYDSVKKSASSLKASAAVLSLSLIHIFSFRNRINFRDGFQKS